MSTNDRRRLFDWIGKIEPRLLALCKEIMSIRDGGGPYFCANEWWYWGGDPHSKGRKPSLKGRLHGLVGAGRMACPTVDVMNESYLRSSEAYDVVYQSLYSMLPDCRDCACMAFMRLL